VKRWSRRTEVIERAAREFRDRYGRAPRAGELAGMSVATRGTKTVTAEVDVSAAWRAVGEEHGLERGRAEALFESPRRSRQPDVRGELLRSLSRSARWSTRAGARGARAWRSARAQGRPPRPREHVGWSCRGRASWLSSRVAGGRRASCASSSSARSPRSSSAPTRRPPSRRRWLAPKRPERAGERVGRALSDEQQQALETDHGPGGVTCWSVRRGPARASCSERRARRGSVTVTA
jgi:hypothetical protein